MTTRKHNKLLTAVLIALMVLTVMPFSVFAAGKPAVPKSVKMTYDHKYPAGSGLEVFLKWKKVKNADGYQVFIKGRTGGSDGMDLKVRTYKKTTKKTKYRVFAGGTCDWISAKVRAYRLVNGKKVYGKWSSLKKRSTFKYKR